MPIMISTDSIMHAFHNAFNNLMENIEEHF